MKPNKILPALIAATSLLTANTPTLSDEDGVGALVYVWKANDTVISGANSATLLLSQAEVGKTVTVEISYTDGAGTVEGPFYSSATATVAHPMNPRVVFMPVPSKTARSPSPVPRPRPTGRPTSRTTPPSMGRAAAQGIPP